jgi:hypothetical protein
MSSEVLRISMLTISAIFNPVLATSAGLAVVFGRIFYTVSFPLLAKNKTPPSHSLHDLRRRYAVDARDALQYLSLDGPRLTVSRSNTVVVTPLPG